MSDEDPKPTEGEQGPDEERPAPRPDPRLQSREKLGLKPDPKLVSIVGEGEQEASTSENVSEAADESAQEE